MPYSQLSYGAPFPPPSYPTPLFDSSQVSLKYVLAHPMLVPMFMALHIMVLLVAVLPYHMV